MSYILEALRKADAQRERSRAPGLHAQPLAAAPAVAAKSWRGPVTGAVVALGAVSVLLAAWRIASDGDAVAAQTPLPAIAAAPVVETQPPAVAQPAPPQPAAAIVPPPPEPIARPVETERPAPVARATEPAPQAQSTSAPAAAAPAPEPALANAAPAGTPQLAVTGGVYSQNPAQRMLIVNGQVFNEGSEVASGVKLEEVRPKQAVLNFRGQRFTLPY